MKLNNVFEDNKYVLLFLIEENRPRYINEHFGYHFGYERGVLLSHEYHVLRRVDTVCRIRLGIKCKCMTADVRVTYCCVFFVRQNKVLEAVPAFRNYDVESQEYDEGYIDLVMAHTGGQPSGIEKLPSKLHTSAHARPAILEKCKKCNENYQFNFVVVPDSTWLAIVEFPDTLRKMKPIRLVDSKLTKITIGGVIFVLGFILIFESEKHFISLHYYKDEWFLYDDLGPAKMIKVDLNKFDMNTRENIRAFYYRAAENNPHRCVRKQDEIESATSSW